MNTLQDSITSIGICCFKLDDIISNIFCKKISCINYYDLDNNINNINISCVNKFTKYNNMIKFLLVKRKHSLNYIDFIRGKYDILDISPLFKMFNYMSKDEIDRIHNMSFDNMWNKLWKLTARSKKYSNEYNRSKKKFNEISTNGTLAIILNTCTPYETTEWEIPKGRKEPNEKNIDCAIREFTEETSIDRDSYTILTSIDPIHDNFIGTNNKNYRHIFYTAMMKSNMMKSNMMKYNDNIEYEVTSNEIEEVRWCTWEDAIILLRPYNENKIKIITNIFLFIVNINEMNSHNEELEIFV